MKNENENVLNLTNVNNLGTSRMGPYILLQSGLCSQHFKFTYIFARVPGSGWYSILLASDAFPVYSVLFTN